MSSHETPPRSAARSIFHPLLPSPATPAFGGGSADASPFAAAASARASSGNGSAPMLQMQLLKIQDPLGVAPRALESELQGAGGSGSGASASSAGPKGEQPLAAVGPVASAGEARTADAAPAPPLLTTTELRIQRFREELERPRVRLGELRLLARDGIPDAPGLRATTWKLLMGYLPADRGAWPPALSRKRADYIGYCADILIDPKRGEASGSPAAPVPPPGEPPAGAGGGAGVSPDGGRSASATGASSSSAIGPGPAAHPLASRDVTHSDHPLSLGHGSAWKAFFGDTEMREQIQRDVMRTHPDLHFFSADSPAAQGHRAGLRRSLFVFAKLNPGIRYVQGMNELLAPLYFVFRTDPACDSDEHAEADAFFCFVELMADFRDFFCESLDNSHMGIHAALRELMGGLQRTDAPLHKHLTEALRINPQFFAFRWMTLLLTQEFELPWVLRLWDTLLAASDGRYRCLLRLCTSLLVSARETLLAADFAGCVKGLQHYVLPEAGLDPVLALAAAMQREAGEAEAAALSRG